MFSIFTGLGMKPISQPSFTRRPIHQSLLNFCTHGESVMNAAHIFSHTHSRRGTNLFDVQELFGLEGDGHARDGDVVIVTGAVVDVGADGKRDRFGLAGGKKGQKCLSEYCRSHSQTPRLKPQSCDGPATQRQTGRFDLLSAEPRFLARGVAGC